MKLIHTHSVRFLRRHMLAAIWVAAVAVITGAAIIILNWTLLL